MFQSILRSNGIVSFLFFEPTASGLFVAKLDPGFRRGATELKMMVRASLKPL